MTLRETQQLEAYETVFGNTQDVIQFRIDLEIRCNDFLRPGKRVHSLWRRCVLTSHQRHPGKRSADPGVVIIHVPLPRIRRPMVD